MPDNNILADIATEEKAGYFAANPRIKQSVFATIPDKKGYF